MLEVILHTIIDDLRGNENKVFKINNKVFPRTTFHIPKRHKYKIPEAKERRWWGRASVWIAFAKVGLPVAYMLVALAIVVPGIINIVVEGTQ